MIKLIDFILELFRDEDHAIELPHAAGREQLGHFAEASLEHGEVRTSGGQLTTARHCRRIAVDREHLLRARLQDGPAVAAGAERGVKIDTADTYGERREHLAQQYRRVPPCPGLATDRRIQRAAALLSGDFDRAITFEQYRSTPTCSPPTRRPNHGVPNSAASAPSGLAQYAGQIVGGRLH